MINSNIQLTVIIPFRSNVEYEYILNRLRDFKKITESYKYILVDSGSPEEHLEEIREICKEKNIIYKRIDTTEEVFSAGKARDYGLKFVDTEFCMFCDIDIFPIKNMEEKITKQIEIEIEERKKSFIVIPCFYLTEKGTEKYMTENNIQYFDEKIHIRYLEGDKELVQTYAPSTSIIIFRTNYMLEEGGHDNDFFGHGYEDFELINRLMVNDNRIQRSKNYYNYTVGWKGTEYEGFRASYSLLGRKSMLSGLYMYHLYHPTPDKKNYKKNQENNKDLLKKKQKQYIIEGKKPEVIVKESVSNKNILFLQRENSSAYNCIRGINPYVGNIICKTEEEIFKDEYTEEEIERFIDKNEIKKIIFPNPYGNKKRLLIYKYVKNKKMDYYCFDRGALPESWFFDDKGFNYDSQSYKENYWNKEISIKEQEEVKEYINNIFKKNYTLEKQSERSSEKEIRKKYKLGNKKILFVPMQRPSDTVIKYFTKKLSQKNKNPIENFVGILEDISKELGEDWLLVVKQHPLENYELKIKNSIIVDKQENIYDLVELSNSVLLINSGVGIYSMIMGKPTLIFGDAFYSIKDVNIQIENHSIQQIINIIKEQKEIDMDKVYKFIKYLKNDFYSFGEVVTEEKMEKDGSLRTLTKEIDYYVLNIKEKKYKYKKDNRSKINIDSPLYERYHNYFFSNNVKQKVENKLLKMIKKNLLKVSNNKKYQKLVKEPKKYIKDAIKNKRKKNVSN